MSDSYDVFIEQPANTELSERELEILKLLATGLSNKEIASQLFLSVNTVKVHLRNIFAKLGAQSRTEATLIAIQRGYVMVPGAVPAGGEAAIESERIGIGDQAAAEPAPAASRPTLETEPALPIKRRLVLIGLAILAIGLAVIAVPRGSAQGSGKAQPFSDSASASAAIALQTGDTVWQQLIPMSLP